MIDGKVDGNNNNNNPTHTHIRTYTHIHIYTYAHTYIHTQRERERETDRQTERQRERGTEREREREREIRRDSCYCIVQIDKATEHLEERVIKSFAKEWLYIVLEADSQQRTHELKPNEVIIDIYRSYIYI